MKNTVEKINQFIQSTLTDPNRVFDGDLYGEGYKQALVNIYDIIFDSDPKNCIGKYGYFWDDDKSNVVYYSKLSSIIDREDYFYVDNTKNEFQNFSLTIPEHLK